MEGFATVQMGVKSFAALTMFGERGFYSGHVYQPDVNHRQVNFWSYHDATNTEETGSEKGGVSSVSLIESMSIRRRSDHLAMERTPFGVRKDSTVLSGLQA